MNKKLLLRIIITLGLGILILFPAFTFANPDPACRLEFELAIRSEKSDTRKPHHVGNTGPYNIYKSRWTSWCLRA